MSQLIILLRINTSPFCQWYKAFATGGEDSDIYAGWLMQQIEKYNICGANIDKKFKCDNSEQVLTLFNNAVDELFRMAEAGNEDARNKICDYNHKRNTKNNGWFAIKKSEICRMIKEANIAVNGRE